MDSSVQARPHPGFILQPPPDLGGWIACFDPAELPILPGSAWMIEDCRGNEDAVDAHLLADALASDALFTIKLFAHLARLRRGRASEPETLVQAFVMFGITPFFRDFGPQPTVDEHLASVPAALAGFHAVQERARRAARFALAFAVQRMDLDNAVLHEAALLHDFAELLLWLRAPTLALEIARRQEADSQLRSTAVQMEVLGIKLSELQNALMREWQLPRVLIEFADARREGSSAQARNVLLAIRLARHTARGWDNAALGDDVRDIADLLHMGTEPTLALLRDVDSD